MEYVNHPLMLDYDELKNYTSLDPENRFTDELLLNSAHLTIERYLDRYLTKRLVYETIRPEGRLLETYHYPVTEVITVHVEGSETDSDVKAKVASEYGDGRHIMLESEQSELCNVEYTAGYDSGSAPSVLKEAVLKTYLLKKRNLHAVSNTPDDDPEDITEMMSDEVKQMLQPFRRKTL